MTRRILDQYYSRMMRKNPSVYLPLADLSGSTAFDKSGNAYNGVISSGVTLGQSGAIRGDPESSMQFDGSAGHITVNAGFSPAGWTAFTVLCWVKLPLTSTGNAYRVIANSHTDSDNNGFQLAIGNNGFFNVGNGTSNGQANFSTHLFYTNTWFLLAGTYDGATVRCFVNGVQQGTAALTGGIGTAAQATAIGYNPAYSGDYFNGYVAQVVCFHAVLSPDEIMSTWNVGNMAQILRD